MTGPLVCSGHKAAAALTARTSSRPILGLIERLFIVGRDRLVIRDSVPARCEK